MSSLSESPRCPTVSLKTTSSKKFWITETYFPILTQYFPSEKLKAITAAGSAIGAAAEGITPGKVLLFIYGSFFQLVDRENPRGRVVRK